MDCWKYKEECLEIVPEGYCGFIYKITDDQGKFYIGKKVFSYRKKSKLSKKARIGTRKRIKVENVDSNWINYWGSNKELIQYIKDKKDTKNFQREILKLCKDKQSLSYWECYYLIIYDTLFRKDCYNANILGRFYKDKIHT